MLRPSIALIALLLSSVAQAQPAPSKPAQAGEDKPDSDEPDPGASTSTGFIGKPKIRLDVDDCPTKPNQPQDKIVAIAREHYDRGEVLYVQGDYPGAVQEFTASYCLVPSFYTILKDIGQAYERELDYQRAIAYLDRYVAEIPLDAKAAGACATDPQTDRKNVTARLSVLAALPARINVSSLPEGATVAMISDTGIAARGIAGGNLIETRSGHYQINVSLEGYETVSKEVDLEVGKPYGYFFSLVRQKGRLNIVSVPENGTIFLDGRAVGSGSISLDLTAGNYNVRVEATDHISAEQTITVLPKKDNRAVVSLIRVPQSGRTQLLVGLPIAATLVGLGFDTTVAQSKNAGVFSAGIISLAAGYFLIPRDIPLGASSLSLTGMFGGVIAGNTLAGAVIGTDNSKTIGSALGIAGLGIAGYQIGRRLRISPGDAALINSGVIWGTAVGGLFALTFKASAKADSAVTLSGLAVGTLTAALLTRSFELSRTHVALIDLGGVLGAALGYSASTLRTGKLDQSMQPTAAQDQTLGHFVLAGIAVGMLSSALLTRNYDRSSSSALAPGINAVRDSDGKNVTTLGVTGSF
jgi:hypothetical protein